MPSLADVSHLERSLSISLPEVYQEYLLKQNGGHFRGEVGFEVQGVTFWLASMFGINCSVAFCRLGALENMGFLENNEPVVLLPIGVTSRDELILLDVIDRSVLIFVNISEEGEVFGRFDSFALFVDALRR